MDAKPDRGRHARATVPPLPRLRINRPRHGRVRTDPAMAIRHGTR
jgi:hypothetical protein